MSRVPFIAFIRDHVKNAEFIYTYAETPGGHDRVLEAARRKYPTPDFTVHTTYSLEELEEMTSSIRRWTATKAAQKSLPQGGSSYPNLLRHNK